MRILNVTQSYDPFFEFGGPPAKVLALSEGLVKLGHEVTVLTADWGLEKRLNGLPDEGIAERSPFGWRRRKNGVTSIYLANWLHFRATSWNPALPRYLRARISNFDVVHIFGLYDLLGLRVAAACRAHGIPYLIEPIGMFLPIVRSVKLKRIYHQVFGRSFFPGASAVIATSEQEYSELLSGAIPRDRIVLRRNGVLGPPSLPALGSFRDSLRIPTHSKLILFLGRLSLKKSPELLLQAFARLGSPLSSQVHLAFVGPDESGTRDMLQQLSRKLSVADRVHFQGPVQGQAKWAAYRDSDVFVLPSQNENFGNTAAEAIAVGTPAIVTEHCGIAPLIDGVAGLTVRHEADSIASALCSLLLDETLYHSLKTGCATAFLKLGWDQPLREMSALYERLASPVAA